MDATVSEKVPCAHIIKIVPLEYTCPPPRYHMGTRARRVQGSIVWVCFGVLGLGVV